MSDNYLDRDCDITLQQALDKYYAKNPDFYQPNQLDDDSRRVFFAHDVCHIIFGCDTSLVGEAKVEQWTIHSTNFNFKEYVDTVLSTEATREAVAEIPPIQVLTQGVLNIFPLIKTYLRARKVKPKWNFYTYSQYLDRNLVDIREKFNIHII
jgi:ubiquinone biosynthesis protein Coq4